MMATTVCKSKLGVSMPARAGRTCFVGPIGGFGDFRGPGIFKCRLESDGWTAGAGRGWNQKALLATTILTPSWVPACLPGLGGPALLVRFEDLVILGSGSGSGSGLGLRGSPHQQPPHMCICVCRQLHCASFKLLGATIHAGMRPGRRFIVARMFLIFKNFQFLFWGGPGIFKCRLVSEDCDG